MAEIAELTAQNTIKLPADIAAQFRAADRFVVWQQGDTLYLKRITPPAVLDRVAEAPAEEPLALDEINALVHNTRHHQNLRE